MSFNHAKTSLFTSSFFRRLVSRSIAFRGVAALLALVLAPALAPRTGADADDGQRQRRIAGRESDGADR